MKKISAVGGVAGLAVSLVMSMGASVAMATTCSVSLGHSPSGDLLVSGATDARGALQVLIEDEQGFFLQRIELEPGDPEGDVIGAGRYMSFAERAHFAAEEGQEFRAVFVSSDEYPTCIDVVSLAKDASVACQPVGLRASIVKMSGEGWVLESGVTRYSPEFPSSSPSSIQLIQGDHVVSEMKVVFGSACVSSSKPPVETAPAPTIQIPVAVEPGDIYQVRAICPGCDGAIFSRSIVIPGFRPSSVVSHAPVVVSGTVLVGAEGSLQ